MEKPLSIRHERFAQAVVSGASYTQAYIKAGYQVSQLVAATSGERLMRNVAVAARVKQLRAKASSRSEFKREDLVKLLVSALTTPVSDIDENSPLAQEVTRDYIGKEDKTQVIRTRVKSMGKIEAGRLLTDICGWKEPEKIELTTELGPNTLEALERRADTVASSLDRSIA